MQAMSTFQGLRQVASKSEKPFAQRSAPAVHVQKFQVVANKKGLKKVQVVLTKTMDNLGTAGSLTTVNVGYFRNYLHPSGLAKPATTEILGQIRAKEAADEEARAKVKAEASMLATALNTIGKFTIKKTAGTGDDKTKLFGSVTAQDVVEAVKLQTNQDLDKRLIEMDDIRETGNYTVSVKLHPEVTATFQLVVQGDRGK